MPTCRHSGATWVIASTLLYLGLAIAILAQTILLPSGSGEPPAIQFVASLGQVPAPMEAPSLPRTSRYAWLPLLSIDPQTRTGIQHAAEPPLELADTTMRVAPPRARPATQAVLDEFRVKFSDDLFRLRSTPQLSAAAFETTEHVAYRPAEVIGRGLPAARPGSNEILAVAH